MADISRADALTLIRDQDGSEIWQAAVEFSAALRTFRKVNMGTKLTTYPVIASLPSAGFVSGEDADDADSVKPSTTMTWTNRVLTAEEIAGIVVIPENVLDDTTDFDLWGEIKPRIAEAVGQTLDAAVFFGTNAPASWPTGLVPAAITASNSTVEGTNIPEGATGVANDLAEDLNQMLALVEEDGYDPTVIYTNRRLRPRVRGLRDANNSPIYVQTLSENGARSVPSIYGVDMEYVTNGAWDSDEATALAGDPRFAILGIRQDLTFKFLDQASVDLGAGLISLPQRDLLGLRFKMRVGFQTAQTMTAEGGAGAYPFAVLTPTS